MTATTAEPGKHDFPHFVAIKRIMKLPVVSSGVDKATTIYVKVKSLNRVIGFSLDKTEKTVLGVIDLSFPLVIKLEDPINRIDEIMCKSLDIVEQNLPIVTYTPEEIYFTTKTYVKAKVEPVLKRADSVKQLAMLDDALSVADKYVDKYLPDKDPSEDVADKPSAEPSSQAVKTIRHVNHFSRKLQRRLTRRTIAEAKLLKKQGYDTVQCFVYFADLLAKDPKAFAEKMQAIWKHLSEDEPENQKPPENIEQLIEMLSREGARRFVHVTNFVVKNVYKIPTFAGHAINYATHEALILADKIIKFAHLEKAKGAIIDGTNKQIVKYNKFVNEVRNLILNYLSVLSKTINEPKSGSTAQAENDNKSNAAKANSGKAAEVNNSNGAKAQNNGKTQKDEKKNSAAPASSTTNAQNS